MARPSFTFKLDYNVTGTLAAGSTVVVYLSPNQGAINGNAGGDEAGYIADVESNFVVLDVGNLSGSGNADVRCSCNDGLHGLHGWGSSA